MMPIKPSEANSWDDLIAAGRITRGMVEALEAPDPMIEQMRDIGRRLAQKQQSSSDR